MYPPEIEELRALGESGDARACFDLAWRYYLGNGITQDKSKARHWYSEAESGGVAEARDILRVLDAEAQRTSELESLIQRDAVDLPGRRHPVVWVVAGLLVTVLGSVGITWRVLNREPVAAQTPAEGSRMTRIGNQGVSSISPIALSPAPEEVAMPDTSKELFQPASVEALSPDRTLRSAGASQIAPLPRDVADPNAEEHTSGGSRETDSTVWDINDIVRFAERWLEEPSGPAGFRQPGTDAGKGPEDGGPQSTKQAQPPTGNLPSGPSI